MGMLRSGFYALLAAGALYVGAKTGGCDYVLQKAGVPQSARRKATDSSKKYVKTVDSLADTAGDMIKDYR